MDRIFANVMAYFRQKDGLSQKSVTAKTGIAQSELSKMGCLMIHTALTTEVWLDDEEEEKKNERTNKHKR